ncbi:cytochrome c [Bordetella sp. 2513F-2]
MTPTARRFGYLCAGLAVLVLAALGLLYAMGTRSEAPPPPAGGGDPAQRIERGRYLARLGNCAACHTAQGGIPYAGGTPIPTPFGTLYGPNITPDRDTGIGAWTAEDFWHALHNGQRPDGTLLYPAFPYTEYTRLTRADTDALYAYLRSLQPVRQPSRPHALAAPYDRRILLAAWRALYFSPGVAVPRADRPQAWNRGRYLVEGLGHCAACHAPRNRLGATQQREQLPGGVIAGLGWYAPSLGGDLDSGLGRWSEQDIAALLQTGLSRHAAASGPMAEVVRGSTQYLTDDDARAIGVYLKSLPATPAPPPAGPVPDAAMQIGRKLYGQHCVQCHGESGEGAGTDWPALAGNPGVTAPSALNVIRMVLEGGYAPATAANPRPHGMPPFGQVLNDNDVAMLATYVRNQWGNRAGPVQPLEVKRARDYAAR